MGAYAGRQASHFATAKFTDNAKVTIQVPGGRAFPTMAVKPPQAATISIDVNVGIVAGNFPFGIVLGHGRYRREQDKTPQNRQFTHFPPSSSFDATGTLMHHLEHLAWVQAF